MNKALAVVDRAPQGPFEETKLLEWTVGKAHIRLKLADIDRLGCLPIWQNLSRLLVRSWTSSQRASSARTYLGESLVLIEHAQDVGRAILRSSHRCTRDRRFNTMSLWSIAVKASPWQVSL
jgi:hypothetical protein